VKIYPNPVRDELTISISGNEKAVEMTITDINGKKLVSENVTITSNELIKKLDVSKFAKGIYFVRISSGERSYSEKLVIR
jgi:hypothetical protein